MGDRFGTRLSFSRTLVAVLWTVAVVASVPNVSTLKDVSGTEPLEEEDVTTQGGKLTLKST